MGSSGIKAAGVCTFSRYSLRFAEVLMEVKHGFYAVSSKYLQLTLAAFPMPLSAADVQLFDFQRLFFVPSSAGLVIFSANPPPIPSAVCFLMTAPISLHVALPLSTPSTL